jgi:hypothetical protein
MITRNLVRRLERLEACFAPPSDEPALIIHLTGRGTCTSSALPVLHFAHNAPGVY